MSCLNTKKEWLEYARENAPVLTVLLENWHPINLANPLKPTERFYGSITAHDAESACALVRENIAAEETGDPTQRFQRALLNDDVDEIYSLLNSAWFGVPESQACWEITGFKEAVELLEQPPMPEEELENV